jgi:GT2 family glycosyltransferase
LSHFGSLTKVDDGSTDRTRELVGEATMGMRTVKLITLPTNQALSEARNVEMRTAQGELIAYLDPDAFAARDWLKHLALGLLGSRHIAIGGPNLNPHDGGWVSECVDASPGAPMPVLFSNGLVDHLPGCNLASGRRASTP